MPTGQYKCYGTGIDSSNGMWIDDRYWKGTDYRDSRDGDMIFRRDLLTGENTVFFAGVAFQSTVNAYEAGLEDKVIISLGGAYSCASPYNITYNAVYIRYKDNGIWDTEWEDLNFSFSVPESDNEWNGSALHYALRTDQGYEAYEIKVDVYVPPDVEYTSDPQISSDPSSPEYQWWHNKYWTTQFISQDIAGIDFDPLNPPLVPEPMSIILLLSGIAALTKSKIPVRK